ncbi:MAG: glycosyltransferase [Planctomycetota bacterium]
MNRPIALVYAKSASRQLAGMDLIRWTQMGTHLQALGHEVHLVTNRPDGVESLAGLPVIDSQQADWDGYYAIKGSYQHSVPLLPDHPRLIVRMCRVALPDEPDRDLSRRDAILDHQAWIADHARFVAVNDSLNAERWKNFYGERQQVLIVPTGCPSSIPESNQNPFPSESKIVLFCGSVTAIRMVPFLNQVARNLADRDANFQVHILGRNRLHLYSDSPPQFDPQVIHLHEAVSQEVAWQYLRHADVGVAISPSENQFESELSKIYYYLRAGLPTVCETSALNGNLVTETGHGYVVDHDDPEQFAAAILRAAEFPNQHQPTMEQMAKEHSWKNRASTYAKALEIDADRERQK